jgi:hypothetical protein
MKRISVNIFLTYASLYKDLCSWGQVDPYESERDISRIMTLCETRGERSVFIDFPRLAKSIDKALSRGVLDVGKLAILGPKHPRNGLPVFMNSTFAKVFTGSGTLLREPDVGAVQALRQVLLLYKKVEIPCSEENIRNEVRSFFAVDRALRPPSQHWFDLDFIKLGSSLLDGFSSGDEPTFGHQFERVESPRSLSRLFERVCDQIVRRFHDFDPDSIIGNHGPGAVADSQSGMDKYVFPTWNQRLERVFPRDLHASANIRLFEYGSWHSEGSLGDLRELPAKLIPVNKTQEKPRLIASEPTANQFIQGGLRKWIRRMIDVGVLGSCISIQDQTPSRDLAVLASTDATLATVDLSAASDRLSCWTVERVFREAPALLNALAAARSQYLVDRKYTKTYTMLRKYAPQGNATVFPIQSIVYACASIASVIWSTPGLGICSDADLWRSILKASSEVRVFGDDIILPALALPALSSLLELCQLEVNGDKSHYSGSFAESCGMDAFMGADVTPAYMHSVDDEVKPGDVQSAVDVSNICYRKGLINLGNLVVSRIPQHIIDELGISRNPGPSTLLFTYSSGFHANRKRYNSDLQREEYRTLSTVPSLALKQRDSWESLLQFNVELPPKQLFGIITPKNDLGWSGRVRTKLVRRWEPTPG